MVNMNLNKIKILSYGKYGRELSGISDNFKLASVLLQHTLSEVSLRTPKKIISVGVGLRLRDAFL
jgi:hypothetical protein